MKKERLYWLDFIRTFSMFAIIVFHFNCTIYPHQVYTGEKKIIFYEYINGNLAHIGVALFFLISGASLMYTYSQEFDLKTYLKKRWLGIYPMFYICWAGVTLYYLYRFYSINPFMVDRRTSSFLLTILGMDGYLSGIIPNYYVVGEWFLGCIILLYLIFPILLWIKNKIGINKLMLISLGLYIVWVLLYNIPQFTIDMFFVTRIIDIVIGMFIVEKIKNAKWYHALIGLIIVIVWLKIYINIELMFKINIFGTALFFVLMYIGQLLGKRFSFIFAWFSKYSYAVFLVHHVVLDQVCTHFHGRNFGTLQTYGVLVICIIITFVCAIVLYNLNSKAVSILKRLCSKNVDTQ